MIRWRAMLRVLLLFWPFLVLFLLFLAFLAFLYFGPNTLESMFYVVAGLVLGSAIMVLLDLVRKGKANYISWLLFDVAVSIVVGLYYLLSHHPVMWLVLLPLVAICVPLVVSKYRQLGFWVPTEIDHPAKTWESARRKQVRPQRR
jgi:uncharacterized membrane protein HdeD (DUF308 family)